MPDSTEEAPDQAQVVEPAPEAVVAPAVEETAPEPATPAAEPKPAAAAEPKPPKADWKDTRIAKLAAQKAEMEAKLRQYETKAPQLAAQLDPGQDFEARVQQAAEAKASQAQFAQKCNEAAQAGRLAFPDFDSRIEELKKLAEPTDVAAQQAYGQFLAIMLETGEAPKLLHQLGGDLDEASRLMTLPPAKMAIELTRLALAQQPGAQLSAAPKPIRPIGAKGPQHESIDPTSSQSDKLTTAEWMERREAQIQAAGKRR